MATLIDMLDGFVEPLDTPIVEEAAEPAPLERLMVLANLGGDITSYITADTLLDIGARVVEDYESDRSERSDWETIVKEALKSASQESNGVTKSYPWPNASNINYPLLTTAALQFNARAYPAIVKGDEAISVKVVGKDNGRPMMGPDGQQMVIVNGQPMPASAAMAAVQEAAQGGQPPVPPQMAWSVPPGGKAARAGRVRDYLNTVLFYRMEDWEADTDALLLQLPIVGCVFRKCWYDAEQDRHCAAMVPALRLYAPRGAKGCDTSPRLTEEIPDQFPADILGKMRSGYYREFDLYGLYQEGAKDALADFDRKPRMLLEQSRLIDLDEDGMPEPYIVTVDHETREVLRLEPNYGPESIKHDGERVIRIKRGQFYVKYDFFPDPNGGFYGLGLGHLLRQMGGVIDTAINQMLDAGQAQVAGGGFVGAGVRLTGKGRSGRLTFSPGEYKTVDVPGNQLREAIVDRTFPGPSQIMYNLLELMLGAARDISSVKDVITGDASNNGQVGTTLALIEQGLQVFTAIYKRTYRALKAEYALLFSNVSRYATDETREDYANILDDPAADFDADFNQQDMDIRPVSDPASVTRMQKMARAQFLGGFVNLPWVNGPEITKRMFEAADVEDTDQLIMPPQPPQPNPKDVADAALKESGAALNAAKAETEGAKREQMAVDTFAKAYGAGQVMGLTA